MRRTVRDVMTTDLILAHETTSFKDLVALMRSADVSAVPVTNQDDKLVGIVTEADLLRKQAANESPATSAHDKAAARVARELMATPVFVTHPEATLAQAARLMHEYRLKHLPVTDDTGKLVGIVSRRDLLRIFLRPDKDIRRDVVHEVVEPTLWLTPDEAGLGVDVSEGVVRLEGTVERRSTVRILVGLTWGIDGVVGVENGLSFRTDDELVPSGRAGRPEAAPLGPRLELES